MLEHAGSANGRVGQVLAVTGGTLLGVLDQCTAASAGVAIGDLVAVRTGAGRAIAVVHALRRGRRGDDPPILEAQFLGALDDGHAPGGKGAFRRGVAAFPLLDAAIAQVTAAEMIQVYAQPARAHVRIGALRQNPTVPAYVLTDGLLGRHFAVLGSTGSGKSCAVTVILSAILDAYPDGHIVLLDPHNEYARAFAGRAELLDPTTLELPYWLLNFEEIAAILVPGQGEKAYGEAAILKDAILRAKLLYAGTEDAAHISVDTPVPYRLSDLARILDDLMGTLNKADGAAPYRHLLARLASVRNDRRYAFMFESFAVRDVMPAVLGRLLRLPVAGRPLTIIDISGVPSEIVDVAVAVLFRLIFEFALWAERATMPPVLLVCEEAHRYIPQDRATAFAPSRDAIARIAREGRKYGVSLCLVSQRPAELCASSLSQCNTIVALRLSNEQDQAFIANVMPDGSAWMLKTLPALATGEAVIVGEGVAVPMHVTLATLPPEARPASLTPSFSAGWSASQDDSAIAARTVERWRRQQR